MTARDFSHQGAKPAIRSRSRAIVAGLLFVSGVIGPNPASSEDRIISLPPSANGYDILIVEKASQTPTPQPSQTVPSPTPTTPAPSPTPTATTPSPTPAPSSGKEVLPAGARLEPKNMIRGEDGIWRSTPQKYLNSHMQVITDRPAKWIRYKIRRQTNVIPLTAGFFVNAKIWRSWGQTTLNYYVGLAWVNDKLTGKPVSDGAYKFTRENPTANLKWNLLPYVKDQWIDEVWEWDFEKGTFAVTIGKVLVEGKFDPKVDQFEFGPQCVIATDPAPVGYPANAYVNFQFVSFEWRG